MKRSCFTSARFKQTLLVSSLALSLGLSAAALADRPTVKVVTDPSFVPFEMLDPDTGEMIGFDMDIINEVAERAGFEVDLTTMEFAGIIPAVQTGSQEIAIAGVTITEERAEIVDFSDPYYDSGLQIIVRADNDSVETIEDLEGLSVATRIGSTSYDFLQDTLGDSADITPYPGNSDMYMALLGRNVAPSPWAISRGRSNRVTLTRPLTLVSIMACQSSRSASWAGPLPSATPALLSNRRMLSKGGGRSLTTFSIAR
ncbi:Glutamine-binding periplasmic protein precursor [Halomonas chromatireducens]|uniref:Glutamine-binding periplasmic protein n=1 Tax=Halomonas chromatireducens TaxID=507626 RepID=A0A0X8HCQ1_9GAMM|nr:Glutamine-binding periplasmic protein precursor [Halomonas chromatireducens]